MATNKFLIVTNVIHVKENEMYFGYAPYVSEINIWLKYVDHLMIVAPLQKKTITAIDLPYDSNSIIFKKVPDFNFTTITNTVVSVFKMPIIFWYIFRAMNQADHIHLRCPGNMGLIGCIIQIFFPHKTKTAKYAGNWDPKSIQPWTYKLQKFILNNSFLTKNMKVLVYGDWANQSKNIKPFFTATYLQSEKEIIQKSDPDKEAKFVFVGSLSVGKRPLYAVKIVEQLIQNGNKATLDLYGEGPERNVLEKYIKLNNLEKQISLMGNQSKDVLKEAYKKSHFVILPSRSEGWPKAIAEGMFWGCIPIATKISCIPFMLDHENRGILLSLNLKDDGQKIEYLFRNKNAFDTKSKNASNWSKKYTLDVFKEEIKKMLS